VHLLATVEAACPALGVRALHLEVDHVNERAKGLYVRAGYADHERYLMTKVLPR
jgi:ribosomal protein S18 acetylase RimI-like enzyme